ncbi:MAG: hypothetical protein AVO33_06530 [delta proteobacterium ML8_F1]|nr:MAG: hypothetical protein AVO33_06530 [delta proteobacterium ML8_F1]
MIQVGINTVYLNLEQIKALGFNRVEFVLGRGRNREESLGEIMASIQKAKTMGFPFSIHLPLLVWDWYQEDYLSAFYLDEDPTKRELSFRLLEENLKFLGNVGADYYIIHFQGVYRYYQEKAVFNERLEAALCRIDALGKTYGVKILLEYFGSNFMFYEPAQWVERIMPYENLGILVDTGHLYYASILHGFEMLEALETLGKWASAFHLWTTKGDKAYSDSAYYRDYHHMVVHTDQTKAQGFAFDTRVVLEKIAAYGKPMVIEASQIYRGKAYFMAGIRSVLEFLETGGRHT